MPMPPQKHIVESDALGEAGNVSRDIDIVIGAINPDPFTNLNQVKAGSYVQALSVEMDYNCDTPPAAANPAVLEWFIWYNINGAQTPPTPLLVGQSHLKNQVFMQGGGLFTNADARRAASFRFMLRIPKAYQMINDGDKITLRYKYIQGTPDNFDTRWKFIYKEYFP